MVNTNFLPGMEFFAWNTISTLKATVEIGTVTADTTLPMIHSFCHDFP